MKIKINMIIRVESPMIEYWWFYKTKRNWHTYTYIHTTCTYSSCLSPCDVLHGLRALLALDLRNH
jgi:hypothetical protein